MPALELNVDTAASEFGKRLAAITTRYPESFKKAAKDYSWEVVKDYLEKAREVVLWLETAPLSKG